MASSTTRAASLSLLLSPALALALSAAAPACSSSSPTPTASGDDAGSAATPSAADFATRLADVTCTALSTCCGGKGYEFSAAACSVSAAPAFRKFVDPTRSGVAAYYDAAAVEACATAVAARMSRCDGSSTTTADTLAAVTAACAPVRHGTLGPGAACTQDAECAVPVGSFTAACTEDTTFDGGSYSYPPVPRAKVCVQTKLLAGPGSACSLYPNTSVQFKATQCDPARAYCRAPDLASRDQIGTCTPFAALGEACVGTRENPIFCGPGAYCSISTPTGACVAGKADGAPCASSLECAGRQCTDFAFDADAGTNRGRCAQAQLPLVANPWAVTPSTCAYGPKELFASDASASPTR